MEIPAYLYDLTLLYLAVAYGADDDLADEELGAIVEKLHEHEPSLEHAAVQDVVAEGLAQFLAHRDRHETVDDAVEALEQTLSKARRREVLGDLAFIAQADGVVLPDEHRLLETVAEHWELRLPDLPSPKVPLVADPAVRWSLLHDLAFVYFVLAHDTDDKLTAEEAEAIVAKLEEWQPQLPREKVLSVLEAAIERYAQEPSREVMGEVVRRLGAEMGDGEHRAILDDLLHVAGADDVLLAEEERLIDRLLDAWQMDASRRDG